MSPWCLTEQVREVCVCVCVRAHFHALKRCWLIEKCVNSLHRRRPCPQGDWTSHHPRGDGRRTGGELCWSGAGRQPNATLRPPDPDGEHRSVKTRGIHSKKTPSSSDAPHANGFKRSESNYRRTTHLHRLNPGLKPDGLFLQPGN